MNELQIFNSEEFGDIRTVTIDSEPWFVGKDVATALGYSNPQKAVRDHVSEEDRGVNEMDTPSGRQNLAIINESGLYALIFGSKLESAKRLQLYYPEIPHNVTMAVDKMIWFYRCGKETESGGHGSGSGRAKQIYSFEHDDDYIYAAFLEQYGIDLQDIEELHWWKFRALFRGLSEDTEFVKIMGYRSVKITSEMSKEQREFYKKMQSIHALPITDAERKADELLTEALLNGGDITGLV